MTRKLNVPIDAPELTVTVNVEVAEPPLGGVTEVGLKLYDIPLGAVPTHEPDKLTAELKPFTEVTVIVDVFDVEPELGIVNESEVGSVEIPKSGIVTDTST